MMDQTSVLVVDDNEDLLDTFSLILKRRGFDVDTAPDGVVAVDKFKTGHFDVILMDIVMPEMNGVEAFRRIREINPEAKVILMTAYSEEELIEMALNEGAHCVIHKPLRIDRMIKLIKEATLSGSILIVDDDEDILQTMTRALELEGYQVLAADSGEEAVRIAREKACRMACIDIKLPLMDGLETLLRLKKINPDIVTIMMTGYRDEVKDTVEEALADSAITCLYKPFDPLKVLDLVNQLGEKPYGLECRDEQQRQHIGS